MREADSSRRGGAGLIETYVRAAGLRYPDESARLLLPQSTLQHERLDRLDETSDGPDDDREEQRERRSRWFMAKALP